MLSTDDLKGLRKPFKLADHEFRQEYVYISEEAICDRLEEVDPSWSFDIVEMATRENQVVVTMRMTVLDVSRVGVGMQLIQFAGEAEKGAATDALKRCARLFGVGRYLLGAPEKAKFPAWLAKKQKEAQILQPQLVEKSVDTTTGEITPAAPVEPPAPEPVTEREPLTDDEKFEAVGERSEETQPLKLADPSIRAWRYDLVQDHFIPKHLPNVPALNTVLLKLESTGRVTDSMTTRQVIEAINGEFKVKSTKPPSNLGELKKLVIQDLRLVKGGEVHWTKLLNKMREDGELTESMELNQDYAAMFIAIQQHYAAKDKSELKDAG